jgi:hypothetical protein
MTAQAEFSTGQTPGRVVEGVVEMVLDGNGTPQARAATLAYTASTSGTAGITSGTLLTAGQFKNYLVLSNATANPVWLGVTGAAAVVGSGLLLAANGQLVFSAQAIPIPTAAVTAIAGTSSGIGIAGG